MHNLLKSICFQILYLFTYLKLSILLLLALDLLGGPQHSIQFVYACVEKFVIGTYLVQITM